MGLYCILILLLAVTQGQALPSQFLSSRGQSCVELKLSNIPDIEVLSVQSVEVHNFSFAAVPPFDPIPYTNLNFCNVTVLLNNEGANDFV